MTNDPPLLRYSKSFRDQAGTAGECHMTKEIRMTKHKERRRLLSSCHWRFVIFLIASQSERI